MSELICPFCGDELAMDYTGIMYCCNQNCGKSADWYGSKILWQELIRTRKALDVATERLEQIAHESFQGDQQSINLGFHIRAAAALTDIEQITAILENNNGNC